MSKSSNTNYPRLSFTLRIKYGLPYTGNETCKVLLLTFLLPNVIKTLIRNSGGYSVRVPPLPIPNREVKPIHADGTAVFVGE